MPAERSKGADITQQILAHATRLFAARGFVGASLRDIAKAAAEIPVPGRAIGRRWHAIGSWRRRNSRIFFVACASHHILFACD